MISSTYGGRTHTGATLRKGQSWHFDYNRIMNNGNKCAVPSKESTSPA